MLNYEYTTYYTLGEYLSWLEDSSEFPPAPSHDETYLETGLISYIESRPALVSVLDFVSLVEGEPVFDDAAAHLIQAINLRYLDHIAVVVRTYADGYAQDPATEKEAFDDACISFTTNLFSMMNLTFPRYKAILDAYAAEKAHLLDVVKLESESLLRHNDAPQNEGDYSGDAFTSDYTIASASQDTDHGTPMDRVHDIEVSYNNVIKDWLRDFASLFMLRENVL